MQRFILHEIKTQKICYSFFKNMFFIKACKFYKNEYFWCCYSIAIQNYTIIFAFWFFVSDVWLVCSFCIPSLVSIFIIVSTKLLTLFPYKWFFRQSIENICNHHMYVCYKRAMIQFDRLYNKPTLSTVYWMFLVLVFELQLPWYSTPIFICEGLLFRKI